LLFWSFLSSSKSSKFNLKNFFFIFIKFKGYICEAGASLIDLKFGLNIVPKTAVVSLAAPTFNYSRVDRAMSRTKERIRDRYPDLGRHFRRIGLPPKA
jgi:phosphatidylinositol 4-kinase type 2